MRVSPINNTSNSNYNKNNLSFGKFYFDDDSAVEFLQKSLKTEAEVDMFEKICKEEALNKDRVIDIRTVTVSSLWSGDKKRLYTVWHGEGIEQGKRQSAIEYFQKLVKTVNKQEEEKNIQLAEEAASSPFAQRIKNIANGIFK